MEAKTKDIDGITYKVAMFPAGEGVEILAELKKVFGGAVSIILGGQIEEGIKNLGGDLSNAELLKLFLRLLQFTYIDNSTTPIDKSVFDVHFAGRYGHLFKVLGFALEVNYSNFLDELKSGLRNATLNIEGMIATASAALQ